MLVYWYFIRNFLFPKTISYVLPFYEKKNPDVISEQFNKNTEMYEYCNSEIIVDCPTIIHWNALLNFQKKNWSQNNHT